jgi:ankyrin repeat protein
MLADGDARIVDADEGGCTDSLPTLTWWLKEGGARVTETNHYGNTALLMAANSIHGINNTTTCQWLLEHGGVDIAEANDAGETIWTMLANHLTSRWHIADEVTALLRVMVVA